jgi:hypothetical protein
MVNKNYDAVSLSPKRWDHKKNTPGACLEEQDDKIQKTDREGLRSDIRDDGDEGLSNAEGGDACTIIRLILYDCDVEGRSNREGRVMTRRKSDQRVRCDVLFQVVEMYETSVDVAES